MSTKSEIDPKFWTRLVVVSIIIFVASVTVVAFMVVALESILGRGG